MEIHFGALAPALKEQLAGCGFTAKELRHWQLDADAITRLRVRGLLSEVGGQNARCRLLKNIAAVGAGRRR